MIASHVPTRRARRAPILASLAVLVGTAACGGTASGGSPATPTDSPAPTSAAGEPTPRPIPTADGALEPGTYRMAASPWSVADFTVTVPDGWSSQYGQILSTRTDGGDEIGVNPIVPDNVWSDACVGSGSEPLDVGPSVDDLASALDTQEASLASDPVPTSIGGYEGLRVDLTVPDGFDLHPCNAADAGLQIWYSRPADMNLVLLRDATVSAHIIDVAGKRQAFTAYIPGTASDADRAELEAVLDSIRYER
jgi:hypothetical protein